MHDDAVIERSRPSPAAVVYVAGPDFVLVPRFCEITGFSVRAVAEKIKKGVWVEGREWKRGPDGHRYISLKGYDRWVQQGSVA